MTRLKAAGTRNPGKISAAPPVSKARYKGLVSLEEVLKRLRQQERQVNKATKTSTTNSQEMNYYQQPDSGSATDSEIDSVTQKIVDGPVSYHAFISLSFAKLTADFFSRARLNNGKYAVTDVVMIEDGSMEQSVDMVYVGPHYNFMFRMGGLHMNLHMHAYMEGEKLRISSTLSSADDTSLKNSVIYKRLLEQIVSNSPYRGRILQVDDIDSYDVEDKEVDQVGYDDLFFPPVNNDYIGLYVRHFERTGQLMRYLMVGNPGTGKTELMNAMSCDLNRRGVTVLHTKVSVDFKKVAQFAGWLAPCLMVIDDVDLSFGSRSEGGVNPNVLRAFLDVLDGSNELPAGVGVLCSTNALQMLDLAAQRPERFNKILEFSGLDNPSIGKIISKSLSKNFGIRPHEDEYRIFTDQSIITYLADNGVTGAYIYNIVKVIRNLHTSMYGETELTPAWVLTHITADHEQTKRMRTRNYLSDNFDRASERKMGFSR